MNYTWTINAMYVVQNPEPNYVVNVIWTLSGTDGKYNAQICSRTELAVSQKQTDYIPYADLTEEIVTGGAIAVPVYSDGTNWKVG